MLFFTSDLHFGHQNIIGFSQRPFSSVHEMDNALIMKINECCSKQDTLVLLGDIAYQQPKERTEEQLSMLKPKLVLLQGNHDKEYNTKLFLGIYGYYEINCYHRKVVLSHYPFSEWNGRLRGSVHLHGHLHSFEEYNIRMRNDRRFQYDVGVDANNYYPKSIYDIFEFFHLSTDNYGNSLKRVQWC